jgi:thioesterase domain-containing protein
MDNYILSPYPGELILIKAKVKTFYEKDTKYYGWKKYADSVQVVEVEGDHNSIFENPDHIVGFAEKIQEKLDLMK